MTAGVIYFVWKTGKVYWLNCVVAMAIYVCSYKGGFISGKVHCLPCARNYFEPAAKLELRVSGNEVLQTSPRVRDLYNYFE